MHLDPIRALPISRQLAGALTLLASTIVVGVTGYMLLTEMSFVDALYQTVTTVTTVGFREVTPFGTEEQLFTIVLCLVGIGGALYTLTLIAQESLEGNVRSRYYRRRKQLEIERMEDHYILCGFGRVGQEIARELRERGAAFVVIEERPEQVELARAFGYSVIEGDASHERSLVQAGISRAKSLLAASDSDAGNTFITLTARSVNPGCFIVSRVASPHNEEKLRLAGADRVLSLYSMGGRRMVLLALQPLAADFMDTLAAGRTGDQVLAEIEVDAQSRLAGLTCGTLVSGARNATVLGIRRSNGVLTVGPRPSQILDEGDIVIVMAEEEDLAKLMAAQPD